MASDVNLIVACPEMGTIVLRRWVGMRGVAEACRTILQRPPAYSKPGHEVWSKLSLDEARGIVSAAYADGPDESEFFALVAQYPPEKYWWAIEHDF